MYRDELEAARNRIVDLEERLRRSERRRRRREERPSGAVAGSGARSAALAGLPRSPRWRLALGAGALALLAAALLPLEKAGSPRRDTTPAAAAPSEPAPSPAVPPASPSEPTRAMPATSSVARREPRIERPAFCAPRHQYRSQVDLPAGTQVVTMDSCEGCDCCGTDGSYPERSSPECTRCAVEHALGAAGIRLTGSAILLARSRRALDPGFRGGALSAWREPLRLRFAPPVAAFALEVRPRGLSSWKSGGASTATVALVGYDATGRAVDVSRAEYSEPYDEANLAEAVAARRRFLVVEACAGATLTEVELLGPTSDGVGIQVSHGLDVDQLALVRPPDRGAPR